MTDRHMASLAKHPDSPTDIRARGWKKILIVAWKEAGDDNLTLIASGVAFYAFLAFVPLLSAFVLSYGLVAEPSSVVTHIETLAGVMPQEAAQIVAEQLQSMTETSSTTTGLALLLALAVALYGASKGAGAIMTALNIVFEVDETRGFMDRIIAALLMTAGAILVLLLAVISISALGMLQALMPEGAGQLALKLFSFLLAGAAATLLLGLIYRYGPNRPAAAWKWVTPGSAMATILWLAATLAFGIYVSNFSSYNATYGSLGAVIVFLIWLYLSAYILLLGAELNSVLELTVGRETAKEDC